MNDRKVFQVVIVKLFSTFFLNGSEIFITLKRTYIKVFSFNFAWE